MPNHPGKALAQGNDLSMIRHLVAALLALALASPVAAQFSDSYNFLKAVRDRDVNKAIEMADKPGTTVVNTRDNDTGEAAVHIVTRRGDLGWLGLLYQKGANLNVKDREGNTPLIPVPRFVDAIGGRFDLRLKYEAMNPTCSFQSRSNEG
jgi:ankyrin repeat protein